MAKQAKKVPVSAVIFALFGVGFTVRALWRPHRALAKKGAVEQCPGPNSFAVCQDTIGLSLEPGASVLAAGGGRVVSVGPNWVHVMLASEPIVTAYYDLSPTVSVGNYVFPGSKVGTASSAKLRFGVTRLEPSGNQAGFKLTSVEPTSWLVSHGYKVVQKATGGADQWCLGAKRDVQVPANVHGKCNLGMPAGAGFALLPISVQQL